MCSSYTNTGKTYHCFINMTSNIVLAGTVCLPLDRVFILWCRRKMVVLTLSLRLSMGPVVVWSLLISQLMTMMVRDICSLPAFVVAFLAQKNTQIIVEKVYEILKYFLISFFFLPPSFVKQLLEASGLAVSLRITIRNNWLFSPSL